MGGLLAEGKSRGVREEERTVKGKKKNALGSLLRALLMFGPCLRLRVRVSAVDCCVVCDVSGIGD
jgi:hypothetical protein